MQTQTTPLPEGWSIQNGHLFAGTVEAFHVWGQLRFEPDAAPRAARDFVCEDGMSFPLFLAKNGIELQRSNA